MVWGEEGTGMGTARPGSDDSSAGPVSEPGGEHEQRQGRARQCRAFHLPSRCLELGSPAQPSEIVFLPPARSSSLAPYQAGLVMQCVPLSPHVLLQSFRLFWVFLSLCWYRNRQDDFFFAPVVAGPGAFACWVGPQVREQCVQWEDQWPEGSALWRAARHLHLGVDFLEPAFSSMVHGG